MKPFLIAVVLLWPVPCWAAANAWLDPPPPGNAYPAGEEDRQYAMLADDLAHREHFRQVAGQTFRREALILDTDRDPLDVVLRRTEALLADLCGVPGAADLRAKAAALGQLRAEAQRTAVADAAARRALFDRACHLRRQIAFENPLLDFRDILFIKRQRSCFNHMCDQFYGIAQRPGGGLFVLRDAFGPGAKLRDVLAGSVVAGGRLQGQALSGGPRRSWNLVLDFSGNLSGEQTDGGSFLSPALSYDGRSVTFAYVECRGGRQHLVHTDPERGHWDPGRCYHVFQVGVDGKGLRQLTDGTWNDFQPCWMPSGRIAFISERRGGYLRCGRACPTFTLFDMAAGGDGLRCLSFHETNEWNPAVTHDGMLVYTRWDYVDRNAMIAHNPWITTPDGRNPRAVQGNFTPRYTRPDMELDVRPVPGSHRFVATAAGHHEQAFGSLVLLDPRVEDDERMSAVKRLTPEVGFPESQGGAECYGTAWPLSEDYYLCAYDPAHVAALNPGGMAGPGDPGTGYPNGPSPRSPNPLGFYGLYLVDSFGNKELIYRDPGIGCLSPIPVAARPAPPIVAETAVVDCPPPTTAKGDSPIFATTPTNADQRFASVPGRCPVVPAKTGRVPPAPGETPPATVAVANVYRSSANWPPGTKIAALRVYQVFPESLPTVVTPHTGLPIPNTASVNLARAVLGTAPVEEDGSACFLVPARREVFFQALDENGLAITSMRSATQFSPGENATCQGCHEPRHAAPAARTALRATRRAPSPLHADVDGTNPFSYPRLVQPVLDQYCAACHREHAREAPSLEKTLVRFNEGWRPAVYYASYLSLAPKYGFYSYGAGGWDDPKFYRTTPGQFGARASRLYQVLKDGHHGLRLPPEAMHRLTVWLDSCSLFYGVYEEAGQQAQLRGEIVRPTIQ
jgi:hypothetical protein